MVVGSGTLLVEWEICDLTQKRTTRLSIRTQLAVHQPFTNGSCYQFLPSPAVHCTCTDNNWTNALCSKPTFLRHIHQSWPLFSKDHYDNPWLQGSLWLVKTNHAHNSRHACLTADMAGNQAYMYVALAL